MSTATTLCSCENHACQRNGTAGGATIDTATDVHVTCSLCLTPVYCSEQCRIIDWAAHACPNAVQVDKVGQTIFKPYYYEDFMSPEALAELPVGSPIFQSFMYYHRGSDDKVTQYVQPPLIGVDLHVTLDAFRTSKATMTRGSDPNELQGGELVNAVKTYTVSIVAGEKMEYGANMDYSVEISGEFPKDVIYAKNDSNPTARKLAGGSGSTFVDFLRNAKTRVFDKETGSILFWPNPKKIKQNKFPLSGSMSIAFKIGAQKIYIDGGYDFSTDFDRPSIVKGVLKHVQGRLRTKFPGKEDNIKNMRVFQATHLGIRVAITCLRVPRTNFMQIVDVEILVPQAYLDVKGGPLPPPVPERDDGNMNAGAELIAFHCDPRNVDHMNGLVMALELLNVQSDHFIGDDAGGAGNNAVKDNAALQNAAGIIRKYTRAMNDGGGNGNTVSEEVPMEVNAAVYTAVNALIDLQEIEARNLFARGRDEWAKLRLQRKIKKFKTEPEFQAEFEQWLRSATMLRDQGAVATMNIEAARLVDQEARRRGFVVTGVDRLDTLRRSMSDIRKGKKQQK